MHQVLANCFDCSYLQRVASSVQSCTPSNKHSSGATNNSIDASLVILAPVVCSCILILYLGVLLCIEFCNFRVRLSPLLTCLCFLHSRHVWERSMRIIHHAWAVCLKIRQRKEGVLFGPAQQHIKKQPFSLHFRATIMSAQTSSLLRKMILVKKKLQHL